MPFTVRRIACATALLLGLQAQAQEASSAPFTNSAMDAPLFYQLLIGELELNSGQAGVAFQVLLDAARRTADEELFKRVVNIALQARAGDQALLAARSWADTIPTSIDAHQTIVQLLALLNKPAEVPQPLTTLLKVRPPCSAPASSSPCPASSSARPTPRPCWRRSRRCCRPRPARSGRQRSTPRPGSPSTPARTHARWP
jgi:hypothetical protein